MSRRELSIDISYWLGYLQKWNNQNKAPTCFFYIYTRTTRMELKQG